MCKKTHETQIISKFSGGEKETRGGGGIIKYKKGREYPLTHTFTHVFPLPSFPLVSSGPCASVCESQRLSGSLGAVGLFLGCRGAVAGGLLGS